MRTQLQLSPLQNPAKAATRDLNMTRATSKLLSIRLRQSSCTGYVSLKSMAKRRLTEKRIMRKSTQTTNRKM
jgi:hypothetical protein